MPEANPLNSHGRVDGRRQAEAIGAALRYANQVTLDELQAGLQTALVRVQTATRMAELERATAAKWERVLFPWRVEKRCWAAFQHALNLGADDFPAQVLSATYACISPFGR